MKVLEAPALPSTLRLGAAHLVVSDLDRSLAWYERALGLRTHRHERREAGLGVGGEDVLVLHEQPDAQPAGRHAGLYHVALLHASREELARAAARLSVTRTPIIGASDHGTHEAIYLPDPDGNEIELAADRPREAWPDLSAGYGGGPQPLDFDDLVGTIVGEEPTVRAGAGLVVGHLHLHVGDVDEGVRFYRDVLGFEVQTVMPTAAFVSAGGYHHHLAFNVWRGVGVPPAPENAVGLRHWTIVLDDPAGVAARVRAAGFAVEERADGYLVRDPWNIALLLSSSQSLSSPAAAAVETGSRTTSTSGGSTAR
ncbi:MAG TPA: VOC family protein [Gaiellaceae bacterium]|jgi:catechol 2,3-dioxygenase